MVSVATVISEGDRAKGRVKTVLLIWENGFDRQEFSKKNGHVNYCKKCYIPGNLQFIHRKKFWVVIYRLLCTHRTFFRNPTEKLTIISTVLSEVCLHITRVE